MQTDRVLEKLNVGYIDMVDGIVVVVAVFLLNVLLHTYDEYLWQGLV